MAAIGDDRGSPSRPLRQMYLAAGLFKDSRRDPTAVGAERALRMATIDGARALGMEAEIGSLEDGKKPDFVLFDLDHIEWTAYGDPVQALVWSATSASISQTWVDGRALFVDGVVATAPDEADLRREARAPAARLIRAAGLDRTTFRWRLPSTDWGAEAQWLRDTIRSAAGANRVS